MKIRQIKCRQVNIQYFAYAVAFASNNSVWFSVKKYKYSRRQSLDKLTWEMEEHHDSRNKSSFIARRPHDKMNEYSQSVYSVISRHTEFTGDRTMGSCPSIVFASQ